MMYKEMIMVWESKRFPAPWDVRSARHRTGLTMQEAGALVFVGSTDWFAFECDPDHPRHRKMHPALAQLFALKTGLLQIDDICPHLKELGDACIREA